MAPPYRPKTIVGSPNPPSGQTEKAVSHGDSDQQDDTDTVIRCSDSNPITIALGLGILFCLIIFATCIIVCAIKHGVVFALYLAIAAILATLGLLSLFVMARHLYLIKRRKRPQADLQAAMVSGKKDSPPDLSQRPAVSYLYVLGSGGHTTEMMALIKLTFKANKNQHRRYITTSGDQHSLNQQIALEQAIQTKYPGCSAGTHDTIVVTRARSVYQSYLSSIFTSLQSANDILVALTRIPHQRAADPNAEQFRFPHVIVTNGPGTGFVVGVVAYLLKLFFVIPNDRLKIVFVETWARTHKLGLTGKLFHMSKIADLFVVQSSTLSEAVGKPTIGNVNLRYAQVGRAAVGASKSQRTG